MATTVVDLCADGETRIYVDNVLRATYVDSQTTAEHFARMIVSHDKLKEERDAAVELLKECRVILSTVAAVFVPSSVRAHAEILDLKRRCKIW